MGRLRAEEETATEAWPLRWARGVAGGAGSVAAGLLFLAFALGLLLARLGTQVSQMDEGILLVYPWLVAKGWVPYRDFVTVYPPATFYLLAPGFAAGLPGLWVERGAGIAARLLLVLVVNRGITGSWTRLSWTAAPAAFGTVYFVAGISAYSWVLGLPLLLAALLLSRHRPWPAAALLAAAGAFRLEFGIAGLAGLGLAALWGRRPGGSPRGGGPGPGILRRLAPAGALAGGLAAFYLLLGAATGGEALRQLFLLPTDIVPARRLPLWPPLLPPVHWPLALATVGILPATGGLALAAGRPGLAARQLALLLLLPHLFQRADEWHLFAVAAALLPWGAIGAARVLAAPPAGRRSRWASPAAAAILAGVGVLGLAYTAAAAHQAAADLRRPGELVGHGGRQIVVADPGRAADTRQILGVTARRAAAGDRVFVAPHRLAHFMYNATMLYYPLGLLPGTRYLQMDPGVATEEGAQREMIRDLAGTRWVILWKSGFWREPNPSARPGSLLLRRHVRAHFRPVFENRTYRLLEARRPASGPAGPPERRRREGASG